MNIQEQIKKSWEELYKIGNFICNCKVYNDGECPRIERVKSWHKSSIKSILEGLKEREENAKEKMGYDLPTNDFCYSEHDIANSYDKAKQDTISHLQSLIKSLD